MSIARIERHISICASLYLVFKLTLYILCPLSPTLAETEFRSLPFRNPGNIPVMSRRRVERMEKDYTATHS